MTTIPLISSSSSTMPSKLFTFPPNSLFFFFPNPKSSSSPSFPLKPCFQNPSPKFKSKLHRHRRLSPVFATSGEASPDGDLVAEAQEALSEFFQTELGISGEDSAAISAGSSKYLKMLADGVRELDEAGLWDQKDLSEFDFKDKVVRLAMEKGDGGKLAVLESFVGLSLSSAMNVARYLSAEPLPSLIAKVKYMKEIFFSGSDDGRIIGKNARRMTMHLSIPVDEDVQQILSFFEKIEAKRGGLDMLASKDTSFVYLVESFPRILLLPMESRMNAIREFLENIGVPAGSMRNILLLFPPIMFYDIEVIKKRTLFFKELGVEEKDIGKLLIKYPWVLSTSIQRNYKGILFFFDTEKVPKVSVDRAIRSWPHLLGCSSSKLSVIVKEIERLSVRNKRLGQVIRKSPQILLQKPQEFVKMVSFFEGMGFDKETIGKLLCRCPEMFGTSIEQTLDRKIKFLAAIGVSKSHLPRVIKKYPEILVYDVDRTIRPRIKYLMKLGLSKKDIAFMIRRFSPLLGYSIDKVLRPKLEFLVDTMERPISDVVDYPRFFSYSLEEKIKPRFWVLRERNVEFSLQEMLGKNNEEFLSDFLQEDYGTGVSREA